MSLDLIIYVCLTVLAGIGLAFTEARSDRRTAVVWGTIIYVLCLAGAIVVTDQMGWAL